MTLLVKAKFGRTVDALVEVYGQHKGATVEAWVFADEKDRRKAEKQLKKAGVTAHIRSSYKPLLHVFLEEIKLSGLTAIDIAYPVAQGAPDARFQLECYPLAALVAPVPVTFRALEKSNLTYHVTLKRGKASEKIAVFAPNHVHQDYSGAPCLSPTGWVRLSEGGKVVDERRIVTDYEQVFQTAMDAVAGYPWGQKAPHFETLAIDVAFPSHDRLLAYGEESLSLTEALHEDFYFSCLELLQHRAGLTPGVRTFQPGQILPNIISRKGKARLSVSATDYAAIEDEGENQPLDRAHSPLAVTQIHKELRKIPGETFKATSVAGRTIVARYHQGSDRPVMISGGQHANETTGVVGALRAAHLLGARKGSHFTVSPLENPDGYAVHEALCRNNPCHMHHAARFTALGDDIEARRGPMDLFETAIRLEAQKRSGAELHINLHGYPAHEWTRPLSGYVPRDYEMWTLPKGYFLILRYHKGWKKRAEALIDRVTAKLAEDAALVAFNKQQLDMCEAHGGGRAADIRNGFPVLMSEDMRGLLPVTLITEYPDETIYGDAFVMGHTAQMNAVLAAYEAWQEINKAETA